MRNLHLALTALALLAASPASAMKGPQVPLSASSSSSFFVSVSGGGGTQDAVQTSGHGATEPSGVVSVTGPC